MLSGFEGIHFWTLSYVLLCCNFLNKGVGKEKKKKKTSYNNLSHLFETEDSLLLNNIYMYMPSQNLVKVGL